MSSNPQRGGFARSGWSHEHEELSVGDLEVQRVDRADRRGPGEDPGGTGVGDFGHVTNLS
jgi:hypothetical protein